MDEVVCDCEDFLDSSSKASLKVGGYTVDFFDTGPKEISCPVICLPPTTCDASIYFKIQLILSKENFRIISMNYPLTYNVNDFCDVFWKILDELDLAGAHLLGSSLGGFLAQKLCEISAQSNHLIKSLILCNTFTDTNSFESRYSAKLFWMLPKSFLRMTFEYPLLPPDADEETKGSLELAKKQMYQMSQAELSSRLTMSCTACEVAVGELQNVDVTIIEVGDLTPPYRRHYETVHQAYPEAKVANISGGGHFPFLSRSDEFAAYMKMHYEAYMDTPYFPAIVGDGN